MKRFFYSTIAIAMISSAFVACQKEQPSAEPENPVVEAKPFSVTVNDPFSAADPQTKVTLADGKKMSWEADDKDKLLMVVCTDDSGEKGTVYKSSAIKIDENGKATFTFDETPKEGTVSFFYGPTEEDSEDRTRKLLNYSFRWPNDGNATPGALDAKMLCLKANQSFKASDLPNRELKMQLIGNIRRFFIYSSIYAGEKVQSISVSSSSDITGNIAYDYLGRPLAKTAEGWNVADKEALVRYHNKIVTVKVENDQQKVIANSKNGVNSTGIYMTVPSLEAKDLTYLIMTDKAQYVLDAGTRTFDNGAVTNIYVNLDKITRVDAATKVVRYAGELAQNYELSAEGESDRGLSWWYAAIDGVEQNDNNGLFYGKAKFAYTDEKGGTVDWISCRHDGSWWKVTYGKNETGDERKATITATYDLGDGYFALPKTKSITVTQPAQ